MATQIFLSRRDQFEDALAELGYGIRRIKKGKYEESYHSLVRFRDYVVRWTSEIKEMNMEIARNALRETEKAMGLILIPQPKQALEILYQLRRAVFAIDPLQEKMKGRIKTAFDSYNHGKYDDCVSNTFSVSDRFYWLRNKFPKNETIATIVELSGGIHSKLLIRDTAGIYQGFSILSQLVDMLYSVK